MSGFILAESLIVDCLELLNHFSEFSVLALEDTRRLLGLGRLMLRQLLLRLLGFHFL